MRNDRGRRSGGNQHNSGRNDYHYVNNSGDQWNGQNQNNSFNPDGRGRGNNADSFTKFRDQNQPQEVRNQHQGRGGGRRNQTPKNNADTRRYADFIRDVRTDSRGRGGRGGRGGGRSERNSGRGRRHNEEPVGHWYQDNTPDDIYNFTNGQLGNENNGTLQIEPPIAPPTPEVPTEPTPTFAATAETAKPVALINAANIKKEKKDSLPKQSTPKPEESSDDSSSSSSDDNVEAGELVKSTQAKKTEAAVTQKTKVIVEPVAKPADSSSSSDEESSDESSAPVKAKTPVKETTAKSKSKPVVSEDEVVCMGTKSRKYTIPDEDDNDEDEAEESSKDDDNIEQMTGKDKDKAIHVCGICDKKGHTSFECQMICRNCSASYHSLKNCPNPPNLNIALQAFMEFSMQQLAVFNMDKRFAFPAGVVSAPVMQPAPVENPATAKSKKDKRTANKKTKKRQKKKIKIETHESDDDDDDDDDDEDEAEASPSSESESSESSVDQKPAVGKTKRKRSSKQPATNMPPAATFPFPLLAAAGAPYNSLMYPYGAQFNFPK
ncbi:protein mushroom body miniature [Drosophila montana]|uniref:protein mushroom body miniature n=1 Tax=Drosophila montana TaxID=40370 RepID=UPI00313C7E19